MPPAEILRRLTSTGALDTTFGAGGEVTIALSADQWGQTVHVLPSGRIGILGAAILGVEEGFFAALLGSDGAVDPSFAGQPIVTAASGRYSSGVWGDDGSGFAFGSMAVVGFDAGGAFGSKMTIAPATAGSLDREGRLVAGMGGQVSRYLQSGSVDTTFGQSGSTDLPWVTSSQESPVLQTLLVDATDRPIAIGSHASGGTSNVDVTRLTTSGRADPSFVGGKASTVETSGGPVGGGQLPDGRLLVWTAGGDLLAIDPDGAPRSVLSLDIVGTLLAATLDADQRLLVAGINTSDPMNSEWFVRRYVLW
jgi:uncharacterized delta-60 repeat protein